MKTLKRTAIILATLFVLVLIFYAEEDWRGKRAWEKCKAEVEAKGAVLDWEKFIPPPVPDGQNFFKAPRMTGWFVRNAPQGTNQPFSIALKPDHMTEEVKIADIIWAPPGIRSDETNADLTLQFSLLGPACFEDSTNGAIPIKLADVPVANAIENLARLAGIQYELDPKVDLSHAGAKGQLKLQPTITEYWQNTAPRQVLMSVLHHYGLQLVEVPETGIARITFKNPDSPQIYVPPETADKFKKILQDEIGASTDAALGFPLLAKPLSEVKPVRIVFCSGIRPGDEQIVALLKQFYPHNVSKPGSYSLPGLKVKRLGTYSMQVTLDANSAAGYLAWSDKFGPDFDLMREALKRPYARMDGDYSQLFFQPMPNFITLRTVAQLLAQRAQCEFLLGQPDKALRELTLVHDLCRILEHRPTGQPTTLVEAMINVAITGLYAGTIADGFRLHAWKEPQMAALQEQLKDIYLPTQVADAFRWEMVASTHAFETTPASKIAELWTGTATLAGDKETGIWTKLKNPMYLFLKLAPHGWIYQNMVNVAVLELKPLEGFDLAQDTIVPHKFDEPRATWTNFFTTIRLIKFWQRERFPVFPGQSKPPLTIRRWRTRLKSCARWRVTGSRMTIIPLRSTRSRRSSLKNYLAISSAASRCTTAGRMTRLRKAPARQAGSSCSIPSAGTKKMTADWTAEPILPKTIGSGNIELGGMACHRPKSKIDLFN